MKNKENKTACLLFAGFLFTGGLLCLCLPKSEYSYTERRRLSSIPELSAESVWSGRFMSDFENYAADTFPVRDTFRTIKALAAEGIFHRLDHNGIYAADGYLAAMEYPMQIQSLHHAANRFRYLCEAFLTDENRVYLSVIPDKNCFLAKNHGRLCMDYAEFEKSMAKLSDFAEYIKISDLLELDDYYRTDPHWRQEKIVDVANRLAQSMGAPLAADGLGAHTVCHSFYGVYYGQAALPFAPDTLRYLTNETIERCQVYDWQNQKEILVYDMEKAAGRDAYEMFLSGALSLITMESPSAQTGRRLVLFRDSFGSSIAPLLLGGYDKITLVDIRYIHPQLLEKLVDFEGCDVLFLYSTLVLNHSDTLK
ncbi:MAG: hypothetical protein K2N87_09890 [Eubacterium sp.]|nr:hypothetical protein [Eubacterium sp.]